MPEYTHEYVSAAVRMGPIASDQTWELSVTLLNRGSTTEFCNIQFFQGVPNWETFSDGDKAIEPQAVGGFGIADEAEPGFVWWDVLWARIFTTSLNLVPTMRFYVANVPLPDFYFGPGDFAVFPLSERPVAVEAGLSGGLTTRRRS